MKYLSGFYDNFKQYGTLKGNLGDYQHASRLYRANNFRLTPKFKHLYHVVLNVNPYVRDRSPLREQLYVPEVNLLCKQADLPKFTAQTETVNQYNRKKVIQTGIEYQPLTLRFHDDNAGLTSLLWETYFRYYYTDSNYVQKNADGSPAISVDAYARGPGGINNIFSSSESLNYRYGLDRPNKLTNFFTSIAVYQLAPQDGKSTYTSFTLINPYIDTFQHDSVEAEGSAFSENSMTISYESVQYNRGYTNPGSTPPNFGEWHYDNAPSPLTPDESLARNVLPTVAGANNTLPELTAGNYKPSITRRQLRIPNLKDIENSGIATGAVQESSVGSTAFARSSVDNTITQATQSTI
jgi:hypothetical protein